MFFMILVVFGPWLAPHDPFKADLRNAIQPPAWSEQGSVSNLLGTDPMGRDIVSRLIYGARITLFVSLVSLGLAVGIGVSLGLIAGFFGGIADMVIMRTVDVFLALPPIMVAILIAAVMDPGVQTVVLAIGFTAWSHYTRQVRGEVLSLKNTDFVRQAKVAGCSNAHILIKDILPNVANTLIILFTLDIGRIIVASATLSFLGLGVQPPLADWGMMLSEGRKYIVYAWWLVTFPGVFILLTVLGFNLCGDWLRDILDPKQKLR
ncbi:MAG: ABC transporter permease [Deltaproteobacteria bacterium]|nr:ABC transporter permease [Deltaproteobacteria bacterium]